MLSRYLGHGRWERVRGLHRRSVGDLGTADRRGASARQDAAEGSQTDHLGDLLAAPERGEVAQHPGRAGPWWLAAQLFIRWSKQGVWERLLELVQQRGPALGMTFLDGTGIRAHQKAAGAEKILWGIGRPSAG